MNSRSYPRLSRVPDWIIVSLITVVLTCWAASAHARRIALVIGNDSYQHATPLQNARSDAQALTHSLESVGFTVALKQDVTLKELKAALRSFKAQISGGDEVVFYFSGHGVQFEGTNYLIPVDLEPQSEDQVADESVPLQRVLDSLQDQKPRFTLAIIDACRDNPFKGTGRSIGGRGLAPVTAANGQMVFYSAGAGQEALDRLSPKDADPNGLFTRVLIKEIDRPGVPAEQMLKRVRDQVVELARGVNHDQVPALYDQSTGEFYFVPPREASARRPARPSDGSDSSAKPRTRRVHSGTRSKVEFLNDLGPSCVVLDYPEVTVVSAPSHGIVTTRQQDDYVFYQKNSSLYECDRKPVGGTALFYQSDPEFRGKDAFTIKIKDYMGQVVVYSYDIPVGIDPEDPQKPLVREVQSGAKAKIDFYHSLSPNCEVMGYPEVTVVKAPSHGSVTTQQGSDYSYYQKDSIRFDCNRNLQGSTELFYQSQADFRGQDSFTIEIQSFLGADRSTVFVLRYDLQVR